MQKTLSVLHCVILRMGLELKVGHCWTIGGARGGQQSFQFLVLWVLSSTQLFQLLVLLRTREYSVISASGAPGTREYPRQFNFLVLRVLASTHVISASGTTGTREYSVISAVGAAGTESFKVTGTRESLPEYQ